MSALLAEKIARIVPRLGSNHDGEVVATAKAIERTQQSAGLDWNDFAKSITGGPLALPAYDAQPPPPPHPKAADFGEESPLWCNLNNRKRSMWLDAVHKCSWLSDWERLFVGSIARQIASAPNRKITAKQVFVLNRLIARAFNAGVRP